MFSFDRWNEGQEKSTGKTLESLFNTLREFDLSFRRYRSLWFLAFKKKKKKWRLFVTLHRLHRGNRRKVCLEEFLDRVSRLANIYESGFEELIYGLVGGNNMIFFARFTFHVFSRVTFSWQIEKDMDFFRFRCGIIFFFFFFYDTWTNKCQKRDRKITFFHLVEILCKISLESFYIIRYLLFEILFV